MTKRGYEQDFYAWLLTQAAHMRAKAWEALDIDNVAEELEGMARHERHAVLSFLRQLLIRLLKWTYQTERRSRSWRGSITLARQHIEERLEESPSLRPELPQFLARAYPRARRVAADQTGLPEATFPDICPWSLEQLQDPDFFPERRGGDMH